MARVLITSLGVGPGYADKEELRKREYKKADYVFQNSSQVYTTPFIADALSKHLQVDKIFMLGTNKSMWEDAYRYFSRADQDEEKQNIYFHIAEKIGEKETASILAEEDLQILNIALDQYLQEANPTASGGSLCKIIQYGKNDREILENFKIFMDLQKKIQEGDEIYLDITHSFRSIPLFMYLMIDFIQTLRKKDHIRVSGIYYGMFEAKDKTTGYVPVVDLSPLFELTQWTKGIYEFTNYGNVDLLVQLLDDGKIKDTMKNISDLANLNFIKEMRSQIDQLSALLETEDEDKKQSVMFTYVKPKIKEFADFFKGIDSDAKFQFRLAEWYFQNGRYANCLICLTESMITQVIYIANKMGAKFDYRKPGHRRIFTEILLDEIMKRMVDPDFQKIGELFFEIKRVRNDAAHAGFLENHRYQDVLEKLNGFVRKINHLFFSPEMEKKLRILLEKVDNEKLEKLYHARRNRDPQYQQMLEEIIRNLNQEFVHN